MLFAPGGVPIDGETKYWISDTPCVGKGYLGSSMGIRTGRGDKEAGETMQRINAPSGLAQRLGSGILLDISRPRV